MERKANNSWFVTLGRDGELIVTIWPRGLSGRDIGPEDQEVVNEAARRLLAYVRGLR